MKKISVLSTLISFAMICSCQKQDSAAEQQLVQRKTQLDERETALDERERALAEREKAIGNARTIARGVQGQTPDPSQVNAERDSRIQQLPPEVRALIPDRSQVDAARVEKDRLKQEQGAQRQNGPEQAQRKSQAIQKWQMSGAAASPAAATSPTPSPAVESGSAIPSPTPQ